MNLRCKPGDMAIIVKYDKPEYLGREVTCISFFGDHPEYPEKDFWLVEVNGLQERTGGWCMSDSCLLPITPPPAMKETEKDKELDLVQ